MKQHTNYAQAGVSLLDAFDESHVAVEYLHARGWRDKWIKNENFRWIDGDEVEALWRKTRNTDPVGAALLPFPSEPQYCCGRVFYSDSAKADAEGWPRFLIPKGSQRLWISRP